MRSRVLVGSCLVVAFCLAAGPIDGVEIECPWQWVNPMPPRVTVYRAAYALDQFVAVGAGGLILTSDDGASWQLRNTPIDVDLYGVKFAAQHWVAVGDGVILSSRDGAAWSASFTDPEVVLKDVEFGASRFVAVGTGLGGDVLVSADGVAWSRFATELPDGVDSVTWAGSAFYACSGAEVYRSSDGSAWTLVGVVPSAPLKDYLFDLERYDLAWTGSRLVWIGGPEAWVSDDGTEWDLAAVVDGCEPYSRFVGVLGDPSGSVLSGFAACPSTMLVPEAKVYSSLDGGSTWSLAWQETGGGFPALAHALGSFVALGDRGDLLVSANAVDWTAPGSGCSSTECADGFADVVATDDGVVAAGGIGLCGDEKRLGGGTFAESHDGGPWAVTALDIDRVLGVAWGDTGYAAVGDVWAASSIDGVEWQVVDVPSVWPLNSVVWGEGQFVTVGDRGVLFTSTDGSYWAEQWSTTDVDLHRVTWGEGRFVAVGAAGTIVSSADTFTWVHGLTAAAADLRGVAVGDALSVAVGDAGTILISSDGSYWFAPLVQVTADLRGVAWNEERFVAVGAQSLGGDENRAVVLASDDGLHWVSFPVDAPGLRDVVGVDEHGYIAVGDDRTLLRASCLGTLASLDPQLLIARIGATSELVLSLEEPFETDVEVALSVSDTTIATTPPQATIPRGSSSVAVPIQPISVGSAWVTATLPAGLGAGSTSALVDVRVSAVAPRRPTHRLRP